jgi:DHA1 family tetracycline resistance protein-like MFS transporter
MSKTTASTARDQGKVSEHDWQRFVEPWYLAYALQGATAAGLVPIFMPLEVSHIGNAAHVGAVMAAFSAGGLTAPIWGGLADRYRLHRWLLAGGLLVAVLGLVAFTFTTDLATWLGLAFLQSVGMAGAATVANLFVVEAHPKSEWDERIGWLQTFYGAGQVGGLLLAGALSQVDLHLGLLTAAGLTALAVLVGWLTTRTPAGPLTPRPYLPQPARHGEWALASPQRLFHHLTLETVQQLKAVLKSSFGLFLTVWLLSFAGSAAVFSLYPVLMQQVFGIAPGLSSSAFAAAAGLGLALYSPAGKWSDRLGAAPVLKMALGVRLIAFLGLLVLGLLHVGGQNWLALVAFATVVLSWSLLSVSGTTLTARLSTIGEGEGMGFFNAVSAFAGVIGAALGGWAAGRWGYNAAAALAGGGVALGLLLAFGGRLSRPATNTGA